MKKKFIVKFLAVMLFILPFTTTISTTPISAQSGEGADVCTWYSSNGFKSFAQCEKWLEFKKSPYEAKWQKKVLKCAGKSLIDTIGTKVILRKLLVPKVAAVEFGVSLINCMW